MKMASKIGMFGLMAAAMMVVGCQKSSKSEGSMGATSEKATCSEGKTSECCKSKTAEGSMGAVGEKKEGCCKEKAAAGSMGATSEKSGCSTEKAGCADKAAEGSMGAVSEKKMGCCPSSKQN